ncbi:MAG: hypothetical protein HY319_04320 [Armatimonadetes bacterium]|nr:hypothetical protein [Armatimonadota bacterium]
MDISGMQPQGAETARRAMNMAELLKKFDGVEGVDRNPRPGEVCVDGLQIPGGEHQETYVSGEVRYNLSDGELDQARMSWAFEKQSEEARELDREDVTVERAFRTFMGCPHNDELKVEIQRHRAHFADVDGIERVAEESVRTRKAGYDLTTGEVTEFHDVTATEGNSTALDDPRSQAAGNALIDRAAALAERLKAMDQSPEDSNPTPGEVRGYFRTEEDQSVSGQVRFNLATGENQAAEMTVISREDTASGLTSRLEYLTLERGYTPFHEHDLKVVQREHVNEFNRVGDSFERDASKARTISSQAVRDESTGVITTLGEGLKNDAHAGH